MVLPEGMRIPSMEPTRCARAPGRGISDRRCRIAPEGVGTAGAALRRHHRVAALQPEEMPVAAALRRRAGARLIRFYGALRGSQA